jgi:hypothetical protein
VDSSVFELAQFALGTAVAGTSSRAQQIVADAAVAGISALTAHQLAETTLRGDYTFPSRLFEQASSEVLDIAALPKARAVQQPQSDLQGKTLGGGNSLGSVGNRR